MTPDDLSKILDGTVLGPCRMAPVDLLNLAPALLRLWRAASREANTPTIRRLRDYEIDAALHELEAHDHL